jgi:hypothetical protein
MEKYATFFEYLSSKGYGTLNCLKLILCDFYTGHKITGNSGKKVYDRSIRILNYSHAGEN